MIAGHGIEPAGLGQRAAAHEGGAGVDFSAEMVDDSQLRQVEEQLDTLIKEAEKMEESARKLQEESAGEASNEVEHARQHASVMRATADGAKNEIQAARAQAPAGKCPLSGRKLAAMRGEIAQVMRAAEQEKAALIESTAEVRAHSAASKAAPAATKAAPSIAQTAAKAVRQVTHVSTAAVVGPPVFSLTSGFSAGGAMRRATDAATAVSEGISHHWQRATNAVAETASTLADSAPVMRVREMGRAAWENVAQAGSTIASSAEAMWDTSTANITLAARTMAQKAERVGAAIAVRPSLLLPSTVVAAAEAITSGTKHAVNAMGEAKDKAVDAASAKLAGVQQWASNLWPFGEKAPTALAAAAPKPGGRVAAEKSGAISGLASALKQAAACALPLGLSCHAASPALALVAPTVPSILDVSSFSSYVGA